MAVQRCLVRVLAAFVFLVAGSALASPEPATSTASGEAQRKAQSIARQTMSPFCPGRTLADCPSEHAAAWRMDIQKMVERGDSPQQIQEELERRAGGDLSGSPHRGVGYGLSIGLAFAALAILVGLLRVLRGRKQDVAPGSPEGTEGSDPPGPVVTDTDLDERLEQELASEFMDDDED